MEKHRRYQSLVGCVQQMQTSLEEKQIDRRVCDRNNTYITLGKTLVDLSDKSICFSTSKEQKYCIYKEQSQRANIMQHKTKLSCSNNRFSQ